MAEESEKWRGAYSVWSNTEKPWGVQLSDSDLFHAGYEVCRLSLAESSKPAPCQVPGHTMAAMRKNHHPGCSFRGDSATCICEKICGRCAEVQQAVGRERERCALSIIECAGFDLELAKSMAQHIRSLDPSPSLAGKEGGK